jgi:hypothetical protein
VTDLPLPPIARFEFTIDDLVEVGERGLSRSRVVGNLRRNATVGAAFLAAVLVFLAAPGPLAVRLGLAALFAVATAAGYGPLRRHLVATRLREYWRERLGSDGPFTCEVELTPQGVTVRQFSIVASTAWDQIAAVDESELGVEISSRRRGLIVVRARAFATPDERRRFVEYANASIVEQATLKPAEKP